MHTLTVTLKQHTPLIHFQHDQEGATLRASEVKPKLDKFILTKLGKGDYQTGVREALEKKWLVGKGDHPALDYKMRIEAEGNTDEYLLASYLKDDSIKNLKRCGINSVGDTPFFAQEKQNGQIVRSSNSRSEWDKIDKKGIIEKNIITVTIFFKNAILAEMVSNGVQSFFISTNFGTRQSKGFGCFSPVRIIFDEETINLEPIEKVLERNFCFVYKKSIEGQGIATILSTINRDYRLLKSGLTRPYAKSKLMLYADSIDSSIGWDKKYIKVNTNDYFENEEGDSYILKCKKENKQYSYSPRDSYSYYRALLGLAEQFEFLLENPPFGDIRNKMIIKVRNNNIQRYQSPLLFKVFDRYIYLVGNEVSPEMLDQPFNFLVSFQKDKGYIDVNIDENGLPLYTPKAFSLRSFLSFAMQNNSNNASLGYITIKD